MCRDCLGGTPGSLVYAVGILHNAAALRAGAVSPITPDSLSMRTNWSEAGEAAAQAMKLANAFEDSGGRSMAGESLVPPFSGFKDYDISLKTPRLLVLIDPNEMEILGHLE